MELKSLQAIPFHAVDDDIREELLLDRPSAVGVVLILLVDPGLEVVRKVECKLVRSIPARGILKLSG